jgi:hypothetical protein
MDQLLNMIVSLGICVHCDHTYIHVYRSDDMMSYCILTNIEITKFNKIIIQMFKEFGAVHSL